MSMPVDRFFERLSHSEQPILSDVSAGVRRDMSGTALTDVLDRVAAMLKTAGISGGDRIVAIMDNRLESAILLLAAMRHGITLCIQPANAGEEEVLRLMASVEAKAIVNGAAEPVCGVPPFQLEDCTMSPLRPVDLPAGTPLTITFTSGSTGTPKGIVHAAESFLDCADAFNKQTGISAQDRFLNIMPMYYMAGIFNGILAPLQAGAAVVIDSAFGTATALSLWATVGKLGITALWTSPTMLSLAVKLDRSEKRLPECLRRLFVGTGAMAKADAETFATVYGLPPLQSYGLSELLYISVDDANEPCFGTVGRPLQGVELALGADGTLTIRTPYAFLGYLENGRARSPTSPFVTSDLAVFDGKVLSITGRSDDIILRGGVNINPIEVEGHVAPVMKGRAFCVTGLPDAMLGQKVVLVLEGRQQAMDAQLLATAQKAAQARGGRVQIDGLAYIHQLPLGPTGKIRRADLRKSMTSDVA